MLLELHLHLYGCIRAPRLLEMIARARDPHWSHYERQYERAFGRPSPARAIVARHLAGDPQAAADFERLFVFGDDDAGSFAKFQAKFDLVTVASRVGFAYREEEHVPEALAEIRDVARTVLDDQAVEGITHAEQRFFFGREAPLPFVERGLRTLLEVYREERRLAATLAASLPRDDPWGHWEIVQRLAESELGSHLTGVDFCFVEEGHPPKEKRALFEAVHAHNRARPDRALAILYHVGESFEDKSLESAVRWVHEAAELGAHRLGHAIALGVEPEAYGGQEGRHVRREGTWERRDQIRYDLRHFDDLVAAGVALDRTALARELESLEGRDEIRDVVYDRARLHEVRLRQRFAMRDVKRLGAVIEVCPTSNLRIGGLRDHGHHPIHRFAEEGVPFVIGSDDPGIFGTTLERELDWAKEQLRLDANGLAQLRDGAFAHRSEARTRRG
jgi:adenosine deaminase